MGQLRSFRSREGARGHACARATDGQSGAGSALGGNTYIISYDLRTPGRNYQKLHDELATFRAKRVLESQWFFNRVSTTAEDLRDHFLRFIDAND